MKLENLDLVDDLICQLRDREELLERLEGRVYSIILTDGTQKKARDSDDERHVIVAIHPDSHSEADIKNRLGALFVEKLKTSLIEEIESIKKELSEL